jgi:hypothetical protein
VKQVAADQGAKLIDLNACGTAFIEKLGPTASAMAYWVGPSGQDNTHFDRYGAYEMAKCVAQGVKDSLPELAARLTEDFTGFDPASPDPVDTLRIPASADTSVWHRTVGLGSPATEGGEAFSVRPERGLIAYRAAAAGPAEFIVFALDGRMEARKRLNLPTASGEFAWEELRALPKGLYFMQMRLAGGLQGTLLFLRN